MKKMFMTAAVCLVCLSAMAQAMTALWDAGQLAEARKNIKGPKYAVALTRLLKAAETELKSGDYSVMMKKKTAASGDKHDYLSQARYYWPDPTKPDGLPYINRDGESNPELNELDRIRLGAMADRVVNLTLAWYFTGKDEYAKGAVRQLRTWFIDKKTRMNPNLNYAQVVWGQNNNKGRKYGVLDGYSFVKMLDAVRLLGGSKAFKAADKKALKAWFTEYMRWLLTAENAIEESQTENNHSTAYDSQLLAVASYVGDRKVMAGILSGFTNRRLLPQIKEDGSQPRELARTLGFGYSQYNLTHILDIMQVAKAERIAVGGDTDEALRIVERAFDFLVPYLGKTVEAWPYKQISGWDGKQVELAYDCYRLYKLTGKQAYLDAFNKVKTDGSDLFTLLYVK